MITVNNDFTTYELEDVEVRESLNFTGLQRAMLQNLLAEAALSKVNLKFDPKNPEQFLQVEAELQGKIGTLRYLLTAYEYLDTTTNTNQEGN